MTIRMRLSDARVPLFVLRENIFRQRRYTTAALQRAAHGLSMQAQVESITREQQYLLITAFALSCASILMAFFPICGLVAAVSSFFLGLYGRDRTTLRVLSMWTLVLSCVGLLLVAICMSLVMMDYIGSYF
jgi:uncharacterized membrane protein